MSDADHSSLKLRFHGRIIDHLGIQMYQSPTAAIAELVANAWDADAEEVKIQVPGSISSGVTIVIKDTGDGMSFAQCEERYLNVGYCRRGDATEEKSASGRPVLGRKGIGKFAGFGIARVVEVDTVSKETGERTTFELDVDKLRQDGYVTEGGLVAVTRYEGPSESKRTEHGTRVTLKNLTLSRGISGATFSASLNRRFLLLQWADDFKITVNGKPLPDLDPPPGVEFVFPLDYTDEEKPAGMHSDGGWGIETLPNGHEIRWRIQFYREPIEDEELRGVSIFANVKLAQRPFFFNLSGGLGGQHGQEYLSGQVQADYLDSLKQDIIATERQRINWEHAEARPLEEWGQRRVKALLRLWHDRRGEARRKELESKLSPFSKRLERLAPREKRTVKRALTRVGAVPSLSNKQFQELAEAILTAWEQGRLRELIKDLSEALDMTADEFLSLLAEADVLTAMNVAEAVKTKIEAVRGLRRLVDKRELENNIRDYIANRPYLLDPKWETFRKETAVTSILKSAAERADLVDYGEHGRQRIDLALRSGRQLLVVEFMRPGLTADWDHISRIRKYLNLVRSMVGANTALGIDKNQVTGLVVADRFAKDDAVREEIAELQKSEIYTVEWETLLKQAEKTWSDFLEILKERAPEDERLSSI